MSARGIVRAVRNAVLPAGESTRRVRFGLAAGVTGRIDFRLDSSFYFGVNEPELHPVFRKLVGKGVSSFDVGGYRGWTALSFAHMSGAPVLVFEPNDENAALIERNTKASGLPITVMKKLVGDHDRGDWITIDAAAREHFVPGFIKMDIEGGEVGALRGATRVLSEHRPALVVEVHSRELERETLELLTAIGYKPEIVEMRPQLFKETRGVGHNQWVVCEGGKAGGG